MLCDNMIITGIDNIFNVHSPKGVPYDMVARKQWGLCICLCGQISFYLNGQRVISDPGCAVLLPQGMTYTIYPDKESLTYVINFSCNAPKSDTIQTLKLRNTQECFKSCEKLKKQFQSGGNQFRLFGMLYRLLADIYDQQQPQHNLLSKVMEHLEKNLSDPNLSNAELARQAGISEVYFRKLFQAHYGTTPKQYILNLRIQKAKQLLIESPFSISAIAEECGFSSVYHFSRVFKEKTGTSPSRFIKDNWNTLI